MEIIRKKDLMVIMNLQAIEIMDRNSIVYDILVPSLFKLYEKDYFNMRNGVSERNICARLAHHMEIIMHENNDFRGYFADVEYNRKNDGTIKHSEGYKKVSLPIEEIVWTEKKKSSIMSFLKCFRKSLCDCIQKTR